MKKIINSPENFVTEMLEGYYAVNKESVTCTANDPHCLVTANKVKGKVGIATGGGSGHLPLFLGYVGKGMLDGCSVGEVFQSPTAEQMLEVTKAIDSGAGVLYIYGNYNGDIFNFDMASEMADFEHNIKVESVVVADDVASDAASSAPGERSTRRGIAGMFFVYKCAGAAAADMLPLSEVKRIAEKAGNNVRSMGVALSPCYIPRSGKSSFQISDSDMEMGAGIHGESGIRVDKLSSANKIADEILGYIIKAIPCSQNDEVAVLINGLGATPLEEQYIIARRVNQVLSEKGIKPFRFYVGEFATSMEMAGLSISVLKLDEELKSYLVKPADAPAFKQF